MKRFLLFMVFTSVTLVALIVYAQVFSRPLTLNVQTNCGAIPDDGVDDTQAFRNCLAQHPRELVIPVGTFDVDRTASNQPAALDISFSDTVMRGQGSATVIRLIRDENGFSGSRILGIRPTTFGTDVERIVVQDLTLDGGRDDKTCLEAKHTPGSDPPDGRGQQGHAIFMGAGCSGGPNEEGCTDYVRDVLIKNVTFKGISGDAIYFYNNVANVTIADQTITGWCRAGVAVNAYEDCDQHVDPEAWETQELLRASKNSAHVIRPFTEGIPQRGIQNIKLRNVTMIADPTATIGARGLDVEPNAKVCDISLTESVLDEAEIGGVRRLRVANNTFKRVGNQPGGSLQLVNIFDAFVDGNIFLSEEGPPPIYARIINRGTFSNNTIRTTLNVDGIQVSNNGSKFSKDITLRNNVVEYIGSTPSTTWGLYTAGVRGLLDVIENSFIGYSYGIHFFGGDDVLSKGNFFNVANLANKFRVGSGEGRIKKVRVEGNRGSAAAAYAVYGILTDGFRDCGNDMTGTIDQGGNTPLECEPGVSNNAAAILDLLSRVQALENVGP